MNPNKKTHTIIRRALKSGLVVKLQTASITILKYVATNRARDIIEDEIDLMPLEAEGAKGNYTFERFASTSFAVKLLDIITHKYKKQLFCENCKSEIVKLTEDDFGEPIDWNTRWEQYLCDVCHDKIWKDLLDWACGECDTHPCGKGRDCWVNPFPRIMYLCYVAPRIK